MTRGRLLSATLLALPALGLGLGLSASQAHASAHATAHAGIYSEQPVVFDCPGSGDKALIRPGQ